MKTKKSSKIQFIIASILTLFFGIGLILYPETASLGMKEGIILCFKVIIPSLFPFLILSTFIIQSGISFRAGKLLGKVTTKLFRLPGSAGSAVLMSLIGGYPVGSQMTAELMNNNLITPGQAKRMLLFCVNSGPAFVISAVGIAMLGNNRAGIILYISLTLSSLFIGFMSRFLNEKSLGNKYMKENKSLKSSGDFPAPAQALSQTITKTCVSMLGICSWIVIFRCTGELLTLLPVSESLLILINCLTEVTAGCSSICGKVSLPVFAAVLGWGGVSVHCQMISVIYSVGIKMSVFLTARAVNGILAALICNLILKLFPCNISAFAASSAPVLPVAFSVSLPAAAGVLFMCAVFILDVDTDVKI